MKWWPKPLQKGDMIRAKLGSVYHYGIFVSEDEVIQFGPPPTAQAMRNSASFAVISTDIDAFCGGVIVEAAVPETREERKRFSAGKTVKRARAALGTTGYDLIHNNCEHFAYECVYGVKRSTQAEEARLRWHNRPILNVYVLPLDEAVSDGTSAAEAAVYPPERAREIADATGDDRRQKYAAWRALEMGLAHAFGANIRDLSFEKTPDGKWVCDKYAFSLSHTAGVAVAAVSNAPVGVDAENIPDFAARHGDNLPALVRDTLTEREQAAMAACASDPTVAYLGLWTRKESTYKYSGQGRFDPKGQTADAAHTRTVSFCDGIPGEAPTVLSVSGDHAAAVCYYLLGGERPCRLNTQDLELDLLCGT